MKQRTIRDFRSALARTGIAQREFAALIQTDYSAVNRWALAKVGAQGAAWALLDLFEARPELVQVMRDLRGLRPKVGRKRIKSPSQ